LEAEMHRSAILKGVLVSAMLAAVIGGWVATSSGQGVKPVPGPGTGVVTVEGTVNVANTPTVLVANTPAVNAVQSGDWRVTVANTTPNFLQTSRSYTVTWPDKGTETVVITEVGPNGWVRVQTPQRRRWLNVAQLLAIEEASATGRD
jgi:hypothetical protein